MAIYSWKCTECDFICETVQPISEYSNPETKRTPWHCDKRMERMLTVNGGQSALANALAGDRHYEGLVAPDGTLINSRTKHREYMKRNNLTTMDDFKETWKSAEQERRKRFDPNEKNARTRAIIEREFTLREQK